MVWTIVERWPGKGRKFLEVPRFETRPTKEEAEKRASEMKPLHENGRLLVVRDPRRR
jgi:hypothetical protein